MTRPTSDRLRETLFNILMPHIEASRFLDICAGSGAVGIEALSRGAGDVTFIDSSRDACAVIESNLETLGAGDRATILRRDALAALVSLAQGSSRYDIIFIDPPYASKIYAEVMNELSSGALISPDGIVVVEHRAKSSLDSQYSNLHKFRELKQGESALTFYRLATEQN